MGHLGRRCRRGCCCDDELRRLFPPREGRTLFKTYYSYAHVVFLVMFALCLLVFVLCLNTRQANARRRTTTTTTTQPPRRLSDAMRSNNSKG